MPVPRQPFEHLGAGIEELLRRARNDDADALGQMLETYRFLMLAEANTRLAEDVRAKEGASDLVGDTILEALRDFPQFQGTTEAEFRRWLMMILDRNAVNLERKYRGTAMRSVEREVSLDRAGPALTAPHDTPSAVASQHEEAELVVQALAHLPAKDRELIEWRHMEQCTFVEIGERLGITEDAARKRFAYAVLKLQRQLEASKPSLSGEPQATCNG